MNPISPTRPPRGTLRRAVRLLDVDPRRAALAVLLGTLALGSAVALAAVSAWLIARASQMPPVLELSVATVAVRAFGIGRGLMRYLERLVSHDVALRGMAHLRTTLYDRLAAGSPRALLGVRRGDLLARVGADVDAVGDVVVRGLLPAGVATCLGVGTSVAMASFWPPAGLALALCLLAAGVAAPWLAAHGARTAEQRGVLARARMTATALGVLDDAGPLAVSGRLEDELTALRDADADLARAADAGARPAAAAAMIGQLAVGLAVVAALVTGVPAVTTGSLAPVELAVIVLTPLAAFEATSLLPAAAIQVQRSRAAAARVLALLDAADPPSRDAAQPAPSGSTVVASPSGPVLVATGLACGWPGRAPALRDVDLRLGPGSRLAVAGPSGEGKTTLLLTLAGLLPPVAGTVTLDGVPLASAGAARVVRDVLVTSEDAHVFGTSVLENLRVARGDVTPEEAASALHRAGLGPWLDALPDGLDTLVGSDARTVSGGERRRLLLARALLGDAPLLLVDEPAEHLDAATADAVLHGLWHAPATRSGTARGVLVVSHRLAPLAAADEVLWVSDGQVTARGSHAHLTEHVPGYGEAVRAERQETA
ncbi:ABC transporter, CydDC cysteine exporter (CydDC- E) family, permease/ATP-binding protein CydC [Cellulomonas flavigena DSM 20109]|uniref:ABC transporter, CydDC cysteine exporter (CydDC-E) family, permease/ATP-binding protein CydC n=1 Tax=Cellulomonas flavigena (strain ATCC 482 / DSM 20109 / BCRC 11376 / JCM 18109 / NBRC 3775 / NCIMB 8073 / NRS 134) TaxID=446466 RepID=D5UGT1_CELFN|nr:thiol reductant ABC exporter subunit CydC [Cellulomonas flavigena]ADG75179.1 ABC transporter, CydDC cysteine exporter (CydDC- E) family, permease/ATP-binding protein CydC [Cellulomonas flavigena DSM 20109]